MKRTLVKLGVLVLVGAMVNVAVAWGCAAWLRLDNAPKSLVSKPLCSSGEASLWIGESFHRAGAIRYVFFGGSFLGSFGIFPIGYRDVEPSWSRVNEVMPSEAATFNKSGEGDVHILILVEDARGWPLLSMHCEQQLDRNSGQMSGFDGGWPLEVDNNAAKVSGRVGYLFLKSKALPFRLLWPGFAFNTMFYAAIVWLMIAGPRWLSRKRRVGRGLCAGCGYPVGVSEVCTECGERVSRAGH